MEDFSNEFVFHGSHEKFEPVTPKRNKRIRASKETGIEEVIFDEISFHATPYRWIALAYTYSPKKFEVDGKQVYYNMSVDLYEHRKELFIYGIGTLEESLDKLYGDGGYLYQFDKNKFYYKEGLGNLEVIVNETVEPIEVKKIESPLLELQKEGVVFKFVDLSLSENEKYRNYSR